MMALFQVVVITAYGDINWIKQNKNILDSFLFAARGSVKVFALLLSPFFLVSLFFLLIPFPKLSKILFWITTRIGFLLLTLSFTISLVNFFYYRFYQRHIDIFIFEAGKESLKDLYYYIQGGVSIPFFFLLLFCGFFLLFFLHKKFLSFLRSFETSFSFLGYWKIVYVVLILFFYIFAARGSLDKSIVFELDRDEKVTNNILLNSSAINGVTALYKAYEQKNLKKKALNNFQPVNDKEVITAFRTLYPQTTIQPDSLQKALYKKTSVLADNKKPNVLVTLMESWGGYPMRFHKKEELNFLGELEKHLEEDFFFQNFTAISDNTFEALQFFFTNFLGFNVVDANYKDKEELPSNPIKVFRKQGYKTIFITSGKKLWIEDYARFFGFDEIYGWYDIKEFYPEAPKNFYGGFDHTAFDFILEKLRKSKQPLFLFFLTTNNHTPYFLPPDYQPYPIKKMPKTMKKILGVDEEKAKKIIRTYQYANHSLGEFISAIKKDKNLRENLVISAVGDHYSRRLLNYNQESAIHSRYLVPAYFYFPYSYRNRLSYDEERFGSHRDIFPTLFHSLFSEASYFASGNDLFAKDYSNNYALGKKFVLAEKGAIWVLPNSSPIYYHWKEGKHLEKAESPVKELVELYQKHQAYLQLLDWNFIQDSQ